jgi:hypothetical protein
LRPDLARTVIQWPVDRVAGRPDVMKPDIQCVRTNWIWGFMTFQLARPTRAVVLMVSAWPESGFSGKVAPGCGHCQTVLL